MLHRLVPAEWQTFVPRAAGGGADRAAPGVGAAAGSAAPAAGLRSRVVPRVEADEAAAGEGVEAVPAEQAVQAVLAVRRRRRVVPHAPNGGRLRRSLAHRRRYPWAEPLRRVFAIDVSVCPAPPIMPPCSTPKRNCSRARTGDTAAIGQMVATHLPALRPCVRIHLPAALRLHESCCDVVQSVCREVLQHDRAFECRPRGVPRLALVVGAPQDPGPRAPLARPGSVRSDASRSCRPTRASAPSRASTVAWHRRAPTPCRTRTCCGSRRRWSACPSSTAR